LVLVVGLFHYKVRRAFEKWLCISQFQQCPSPPPPATHGELAISGKKMAISPPQEKKNSAKAPPLGKQIGSISPPPGDNIDCLVHVDLHVIIQYKCKVQKISSTTRIKMLLY
jgi:hypothetical protein